MSTAANTSTNSLRIAGWSLLAVLLALPAIAMRFTGEVAWTPLDFVAAAIMLGALGLGIELIVRLSTTRRVRVVLALGLVAAFLTIWAELAVGILT